MKDYAIMHRERHVATIRGDGSCTVYAPRFMPYTLYFEKADGGDLDTRLNNLSSFYAWCAARLLTLDRKYAKEILNSLGMKQAITDRERAEIALSYHVVSLTDVFWVRELREKIRFQEISLYDHSLSDAFVDVSLRGRTLTAENAELISGGDSAGDLSTVGVAPKAWIRRGGRFWLLKDGDPREVKAELLASRIARCFQVDQVLYEPAVHEGLKVSRSELMTSKDRSIVSAEQVQVFAANRGTTLHALVNRQDEYGYHMMNIVDYLIGNTDRHWGNWGFWVENDTNRLTTLHPLMDFNQAFRAYDTLEGARCLTAERPMSQKEAAVQGVQRIGLNLTGKLPEDLASAFSDLDEQRGAEVAQMFEHRLKLLMEWETDFVRERSSEAATKSTFGQNDRRERTFTEEQKDEGTGISL